MKKYILLFFIIISQIGNSQVNRKVLLLDLTTINGESNQSRYYSVEYILNNIKVPYDITTSFDDLKDYPIVIATSRIKDGTLTPAQIVLLSDFVDKGGVLVTSSMRETNLFPIFGISSSSSNNALFEVNFDVNIYPEIFEYVDDNLEKTISIGRASSGTTFYTREYQVTTGEVLGTYENNNPAFVYNQLGAGHTYAFGPDFRDIVYRNLLGLDVSAHRSYSNGFEPTTDVIFMIMRNIIRKHIPHTIYPHTIPSDAQSVVLITHDIDSKTAYDTMDVFSEYERNNGYSSNYNATTKYLVQSWSSYYSTASNALQKVFDDGNVVSSHSVGHFPDFASFDLGHLGNDEHNYIPVNTNGTTVGGTVLGELELSRDLLDMDPNMKIRTFRAGHLAYPDSLNLGLQMLNYEFNTTHSANDILTNYPYQQMELQKFTTQKSTILEIPMTISDVFHSEPISASNYKSKVAIWGAVTRQYAANHAPINLLIHPNRNYKLDAQIKYINELPFGVVPYNFEKYGDFWKARHQLDYTTTVTSNVVEVHFTSSLHDEISFLMDTDPNVQVKFYDMNNQPVAMQSKEWNPNQTIFYQNTLVSVDDFPTLTSGGLSAYPNPTSGQVTFDLGPLQNRDSQFSLYDMQGKLMDQLMLNKVSTLVYSMEKLTNGLYFYVIQNENQSFSGKIIKQ